MSRVIPSLLLLVILSDAKNLLSFERSVLVRGGGTT